MEAAVRGLGLGFGVAGLGHCLKPLRQVYSLSFANRPEARTSTARALEQLLRFLPGPGHSAWKSRRSFLKCAGFGGLAASHLSSQLLVLASLCITPTHCSKGFCMGVSHETYAAFEASMRGSASIALCFRLCPVFGFSLGLLWACWQQQNPQHHQAYPRKTRTLETTTPSELH